MAAVTSNNDNFTMNMTRVNVTAAYSDQMDNSEMVEILHFQYYAWGIAGNIISGLGILGNLLSIIVLANRRMRSSTSVYLIAQSVFDILVLISLILFMALPTIHFPTGLLEDYTLFYPYLQPFAYPLALTAQTCSIYTTVGFTIERFIAVCYPLKSARWCTPQKARRAILLIVLASIVYNIPRMLEYKVVVSKDKYNVTKASNVYTEMGANQTFRHIYFIYMHIPVMLLIPFAILTFMNTMLIRAVRQSQHTKGKVNQKQHKENNLTVMLIAVVIVFLICQVPSIVDNIFMATISDEIIQTTPFVKLTCISSLMVITNSAANFYLYCVFGQKFRKVFWRLFCGCCPTLTSRGYLEHETSLLRGSSIMRDRESYKNGGGSGGGNTRKPVKIAEPCTSTVAPMYRYPKTREGVINAGNGQGKYTSIRSDEETHV